jgi:hypothetical protein
MPTMRGSAFLAARFRASRRVDRGELAIECMDGGFRWLLDRSHCAQCPDRRPEQRDTGEEQERFLLCGGWHGGIIVPCRFASMIGSLLVGANPFRRPL